LIFISLLFVFKRDKVQAFIASHFPYFFYGSALVFGLLHASNFIGNPYVLIAFSPLLGGPQILLGLLLGYFRMKNGLAYSMLFHILVNAVALIL
jgi:membrane protease YdiL (CAAX protease family)